MLDIDKYDLNPAKNSKQIASNIVKLGFFKPDIVKNH